MNLYQIDKNNDLPYMTEYAIGDNILSIAKEYPNAARIIMIKKDIKILKEKQTDNKK